MSSYSRPFTDGDFYNSSVWKQKRGVCVFSMHCLTSAGVCVCVWRREDCVSEDVWVREERAQQK